MNPEMSAQEETPDRRVFFKSALYALASLGAGGALYSAFRFLSRGKVEVGSHHSHKGAFESLAGAATGGTGLKVDKAPDGSWELDAGAVPQGKSAIVALGALPVILVHGAACLQGL